MQWVLLFAVWTNCKIPYPTNGLDEVLTSHSDVFMDSANREVALNLIVRFHFFEVQGPGQTDFYDRPRRQETRLANNSFSLLQGS